MSNVGEIQELKQQLNKLISTKNAKLYEGEILHLSQKLDKLIVNCYEDKQDI